MQQVILVAPCVILGKILSDPKTGDCFIYKHVMRTPQLGSCGCKAGDSACQACWHANPKGKGVMAVVSLEITSGLLSLMRGGM